MIKLVYFGSPQFSANFLEKILTDKDLKKIISAEFVVTQPDKPAGRKQLITPTPVKQIAQKYSIKVLEVENLLAIENWNLEIDKLDLALVYAYSSIVPKELLNLPKYGFWCIHPSLLPKYRGPSPIAFALLNGEKKTGTTIFKMDEKIDHGPIIAQKKLTIKINEYRIDLEKKLTDLSFKLFKEIILKLTSWRVSELKEKKAFSSLFHLKPQNDKFATYSRVLKKEDGFIPLETLKKALKNQPLLFKELPLLVKEQLIKNSNYQISITKQILNFNNQNSKEKSFKNLNLEFINSTKIIYDYFRALYPWPGVWTILPNSKRLKIIKMLYVPRSKLHIKLVQLEGKKPVDFEIFKKAYLYF